jgi:hypothetical protein
MYYIVKILHVWWVIVYRQFHNYNGVIFLYYHVSDSNYHLWIDTEIFLFEFIYFWWTGFYRPYFISDFPVFNTDRIKTYTSENGKRVFFLTVFTLRFWWFFPLCTIVLRAFSLRRPRACENLPGWQWALAWDGLGFHSGRGF